MVATQTRNRTRDARGIANELILKAIDAGRPITPLAAIKLVYFSHAWMMAIFDRELIREPVEAWKYGPVIPSVYHALKHHGWRPITEPINVSRPSLGQDELQIIDEVWRVYGKYSGIYLSALTHAPDTPWTKHWSPGSTNAPISNEEIKEYYASQLK